MGKLGDEETLSRSKERLHRHGERVRQRGRVARFYAWHRLHAIHVRSPVALFTQGQLPISCIAYCKHTDTDIYVGKENRWNENWYIWREVLTEFAAAPTPVCGAVPRCGSGVAPSTKVWWPAIDTWAASAIDRGSNELSGGGTFCVPKSRSRIASGEATVERL